MTDTVYPVTDHVISKDILRTLFGTAFGFQDHVIEGFEVTEDVNLDVSASAGKAFGDGSYMARDVATTLSMTDNATNHIWVSLDENDPLGTVVFAVETSDSPPSEPSQKLATVTTSSGAITDITDERTFKKMEVDARSERPIFIHLTDSLDTTVPAGSNQILVWDTVEEESVPDDVSTLRKDGSLTTLVAPFDGLYHVNVQKRWVDYANGVATRMWIQVNGINHAHYETEGKSSFTVLRAEQILYLKKGDEINIRVENDDTSSHDVEAHERFGYLQVAMISGGPISGRMPGTSAP